MECPRGGSLHIPCQRMPSGGVAIPRSPHRLTRRRRSGPAAHAARLGRCRGSTVRAGSARGVSTPSTSRGPGRANDALASTAHTGTPLGSTPERHSSASAADAVEVVAARRARRRRRARPRGRRSQVTRTRLLAGGAERGSPPASVTISGTQWPGAKGGSVHSSSSTRGRRSGRATPASRPRSRRALETGHQRRRPPARGRWPRPSVRIEASTSSRVCGSMVSTSAVQPEVGQRVVDDGDVDRAHGAEVLGDDEIGVEAGRARPRRGGRGPRRARIAADTKASISADVESLGQRAGRDDACASRASRRVVALEGHPDDVVTGADREEDLGRRGEQRDDAHAPNLIVTGLAPMELSTTTIALSGARRPRRRLRRRGGRRRRTDPAARRC